MVLEYLKGRWPDEEVPAGSPEWFLYEVDRKADAVLRSVEIFCDNSIARNSIWIEQRSGQVCESLLDMPLDEAFENAPLEAITPQEFEKYWERGIDTPFWFPSSPGSSGNSSIPSQDPLGDT